MKKFLFAGITILIILMLALSVGIAEDFEPEEPKTFTDIAVSEDFNNPARIEIGTFYRLYEPYVTGMTKSQFVFYPEESGLHRIYIRSVNGTQARFDFTDKYGNVMKSLYTYNQGVSAYTPIILETELTAGKEYRLSHNILINEIIYQQKN